MLTRERFFLGSLVAAGSSPLAAAAALGSAPLRTLAPEQEEGPFYIPAERVRRDITEGRPGFPLLFDVRLVDARTGAPVANAAVDIWQCDALGVYSGFAAIAAGRPPGMPPGARPFGPRPPGAPPHGGPPPGGRPGGPLEPQKARTFLRGVQVTDRSGAVRFATLFPGFYAGRVNHIHLKVHVPDATARVASAQSHVVHTGQAFFPEAIARSLSARNPYAQHRIERTTLAQDHVFNDQRGSASMTQFRRIERTAAEAYSASLTLAVRTSG